MMNTEFRSRIASLATLDNLGVQAIKEDLVFLSVPTPHGAEQIYVHRRDSSSGEEGMIEFMWSGINLGNLPQWAVQSYAREFLERNSVTITALWAYGTDLNGHHTLRVLSRIPVRHLDQQRFRRCIGAIAGECSFLRELSAADGSPVIKPLKAFPQWRK